MKSCPITYTITQLQNFEVSKFDGNIWKPCRPEGYYGLCLKSRISKAWKVFTGQYEVVNWEEN